MNKQNLCLKYRMQLAMKQYQLSKINLKGVRSLNDIKILNEHIKDVLNLLKTLHCEGTDFLGPEPKIKRKSSTKLKLDRQKDVKKLFIAGTVKRKFIKEQLPPKKRFSLVK